MRKEKSRECTVRVISAQRNADGETQIFETGSKGRLSEREGALYVLYEENIEEVQEKTGTASETSGRAAAKTGGKAAPGMNVKNLLKIEEEPLRVSLKKSGAVTWRMVFEQGKRMGSEYGTPCGMLQIDAETEHVTLEKRQEKTSLQLLYALFIQGEKQADCRLEIEVL